MKKTEKLLQITTFQLILILIYDRIINVMADVVKWLTHWIVVPTCVGSIPTIRPIK